MIRERKKTGSQFNPESESEPPNKKITYCSTPVGTSGEAEYHGLVRMDCNLVSLGFYCCNKNTTAKKPTLLVFF